MTLHAYAPSELKNRMCELVRYKVEGVWSQWEWVNPPMVLGVEYRTTERWQGKPVYTKLLDLGYVGAGKSTFTDGVSFGTRVIRAAGSHNGALPYGDPAGYYGKYYAINSNSIHFTGGEGITGAYLYVQAWYVKE
jgi:hypothetical protein